MDKWLYILMIEKKKNYNKMNRAVIERHIANIKRLDRKSLTKTMWTL